jgi:hypothetical protein
MTYIKKVIVLTFCDYQKKPKDEKKKDSLSNNKKTNITKIYKYKRKKN